MPGATSTAMKLAQVAATLVYHLTVRLAVEFLKIGFLIGTLLGVGGLLTFFIILSVWWIYKDSESLLAALGALCFVLMLLVAVAVVVQYVVRDKLHLTDLSLLQLVNLFVSAVLKGWKRNDVTSSDDLPACDPVSKDAHSNNQVKKTS